MDRRRSRRDFLKLTTTTVAAAAAAAGALRQRTWAMPDGASGSSRRFLKAVKYGMVGPGKTPLEKLALLKELGYDGVEIPSPTTLDLEALRAASEKTGIRVHGVVNSYHWRYPLSHPDPAVRSRCRKALEQSLRDAHFLGASSVLLVPAVVRKDIPYDEAYRRSQAEIRKVLPLAEELKVRILLENVWNNFLLSPLEFARYVDEFESDWVGVYFDVGNVVVYGWPQHWIRILGKRIGKLDIKAFSRRIARSEGLSKGFRVPIGEDDCDWPEVRKELIALDYRGWCTAEVRGGGRERLAELLARMNRVLPD